jgi:hypothetical protein
MVCVTLCSLLCGTVLYTIFFIPAAFSVVNKVSPSEQCRPNSDGTMKCCQEHYKEDDKGNYIDGSSVLWCTTCKYHDGSWHCGTKKPPSKMEGTFNPDITGGAGAGVFQGEKTNDNKDTNIGNNAGVLQGDTTTNNSNNTIPTQKQSFGKGGNPLIDKNIIGGGGAGVTTGGVAEYKCEGLKCTCNGDTDCNNMFEAQVCGDIASCTGSGDETECSCLAG